MKKDTLYEIYSLLKDDTTKITDSLYRLMLLNSESEKIFLKFCENNAVNQDTIDYFIDISCCLSEFKTKDIQMELTNMIIDVANDDYVINDCDYNLVLENIIFLFDYEYITLFDVYELSELDYYKAEIIKEFIRFLKSMKNTNINNIYNHDTTKIIETYMGILNELYNTTTNSNTLSTDQMYLNRFKYFIDIISDKDIYEMDDEKFEGMLDIIKSIENIEELKHLKNIIKINRAKDTSDFIETIDNEVSDFNEITIARITKELGLKREIVRKNKTMLSKMLNVFHLKKSHENEEEITVNITRTTQDNKKELDIVKKVLKPLDK